MALPEPQHRLDAEADRSAESARPTSRVVVGLLSVIAVILTAWALKVSAVVTMPLAFAFFVAILVHPLERTLAARLPRRLEWLGVICAMLAVVGTLLLALALVAVALEPVVARAPQYADQLQAQWENLISWARSQGSRRRRPAISGAGWRAAVCRACCPGSARPGGYCPFSSSCSFSRSSC
jgi:AI-2E family transporter